MAAHLLVALEAEPIRYRAVDKLPGPMPVD